MVVGLINIRICVIRFELIKNRTTENKKKIIKTLVPIGYIIITDAVFCYNWLDMAKSGYWHHFHNHGHGDFWPVLDSTSHIDQL